VAALLASEDKESSDKILETHLKFVNLCDQAGMSILSLAADGAANKLSAQMDLINVSAKNLKFF
jgi:hypothetical protein